MYVSEYCTSSQTTRNQILLMSSLSPIKVGPQVRKVNSISYTFGSRQCLGSCDGMHVNFLSAKLSLTD
jgi:hypothetical protein